MCSTNSNEKLWILKVHLKLILESKEERKSKRENLRVRESDCQGVSVLMLEIFENNFKFFKIKTKKASSDTSW